MRRSLPSLALALALAAPLPVAGADGWTSVDPAAERTRAFFEDGPAWLLPRAERERLAALPEPERIGHVAAWLSRDPVPETAGNELEQGIARRRRQVVAEGWTWFDDRARLLFLRGAPTDRHKVECSGAFKPLEIWTYGSGPEARRVVLYGPRADAPFRAWLPTDSKRRLYESEMEYFLEQFEELRGRIRGKRPDLQLCQDTKLVDETTGVEGLFGFRKERMTDGEVEALFAPPQDLAAWAKAAAAESVEGSAISEGSGSVEPLPVAGLAFAFPEWRDQRILTRVRIELPAGVPLGVFEEEGGSREVRLIAAGRVDATDETFERFRTRFVLPPPDPATPVVLELERALRPKQRFVLHIELADEVSGRRAILDAGFAVPGEPTPLPAEAAAGGAVVTGADLALTRVHGRDTLVLLPPAADVVFGLYRAEAIVAGQRIRRVAFFVDGKAQLTRGAPPWSAELRLPSIPTETVVRAEGYDADGQVVAADEILLNEPQGEPRVKLLSPPRGRRPTGTVRARAAVVEPEGRQVTQVAFKLNDRVLASLERPPWEATFEAPAGESVSYLTVTATFADGTVVEDYRILGASDFLEEIEVDLVEIYATVLDKSGAPVDGLVESDFTLLDNGKPQTLEKFELVRDLPLTVGLVLDTSGSMRESIGEAKRAASGFLRAVMTPKDRGFAVGFSERPALLMPLTADPGALEIAFRDLPAYGNTSLHDALVYSLYQYRGIRGRKAMVLLSDGDDTASLVTFDDALAYAQRSGVSIYTIGLDVGATSLAIRGKLQQLAEETGGRVFYIAKATELAGVYEQIERELRSQYLLAFSPNPAPREGERHSIEVKVGRPGLKARSARGYTP